MGQTSNKTALSVDNNFKRFGLSTRGQGADFSLAEYTKQNELAAITTYTVSATFPFFKPFA